MNTSNIEDRLVYTVEEMAELLSIGRNAAYSLAVSEGFPSRRIGKKIIRIDKEALLEWLKSNSKI